jgi:23S rRNA pseudouridine955/2504/2580 synthase
MLQTKFNQYNYRSKTMPDIIEIDTDHGAQRIDNFLFNRLKGVPKSHLYKMLRKGVIRVNKKRAKADYHLNAGDKIYLPTGMTEKSEEAIEKKPHPEAIKTLEKSILFEDDNLIILNKPSGFSSHGGTGVNFGVIEIMRAARPELTGLSLVHRLDRDTSGCLILAKKRSILQELHTLIHRNKIKKTYLVLVKGKWKTGVIKVSASLLKNQVSSGERMVKVDAEGKASLTTFKPKKIFSFCSLLEADLGTGRTHQIRVHATHSGHPVAGDDKYGDRDFNKIMKNYGLKRLFLHAEHINFYLPSTKQIVNFSAPLDAELKAVLKTLQK